MEAGKPTDAHVINQILGTQITDEQLTQLLKGPRLQFQDLSNTKEVLKKIRQGNPKDIAGVYMWTYTPTGEGYVGSSKQLATRIRNYFAHSVKENGKFLPMFFNTPITEWTLEVLFVPYEEK